VPAKPQRQPLAQAVGIGKPRGVTSLFEDTTSPGNELEGARLLPMDLIDANPHQPRQVFDSESLEELSASIREHGVLEPIMVRPLADRYQIVMGERRFRAVRMLGQDEIPAVIREMDDVEAAFASTVENLQRQDLDIEDEARRFAYLLEMTGMSQRKLAEKLGINHIYLSRRVKLLKRPDLLEAYRAGLMTLHEVVAGVDSPEGAGVSAGNKAETLERDELELIPEGEAGYVVSRGSKAAGNGEDPKRGTRFRWRPTMQFRNWLNRMDPHEVPSDERASLRAQIAEIRSKLDEWEDALKE
jgi:ParB/RepB/Spo0J family partition protein